MRGPFVGATAGSFVRGSFVLVTIEGNADWSVRVGEGVGEILFVGKWVGCRDG